MKPNPPTTTAKVVKPKKSQKSRPKLITFLATLPDGVILEVKAETLLAVGEKINKSHNVYPVDVKKKPFEALPHLTHRPFGALKGLMNTSEGVKK